MLKTLIKVGLLGLVASVLLTGCGVRKSYFTQLNPHNNERAMKKCAALRDMNEKSCSLDSEDNKMYLLLGSGNRSDYGFKHARFSNTTYALIQAAALGTLKKAKKYFSIVAPEKLSNTNGVLINTVKEYGDKCAINIAQVLLGTNPCGIFPRRSNGRGGFIVFTMTNKQSNDYIVWDAQKVLDDLKAMNEYDPSVNVNNFLIMEYHGDSEKDTKTMNHWIKMWH
jgi:hypothetical protein